MAEQGFSEQWEERPRWEWEEPMERSRRTEDAATSTSTDSPAEVNETTHIESGPSLFELPPEVRDQIYKELLPNNDAFPSIPANARHDGQKSSTNIMATSSQVHAETVGLLYGDKQFQAKISKNGTVKFLGKTAKLADIPNTNFAGLNQVEKLCLTVDTTDDRVAVCWVQDALFAFFSHLRPNHKLHTLRVYIEGGLPPDHYQVQPGDISSKQIVAFLTDPLRTIRNLHDGEKKGKFDLDFVEKTQRPWWHIIGDVRKLIKGDSPVPDYKVFCDYSAKLRQVGKVALALDPLSRGTYSASARIRGNVGEFRNGCYRLMTDVDQIVARSLDFTTALHNEDAQDALEREQKVREIIYLTQELEALIPDADADTSFFGYNQADDKLRRSQSNG